MREVFAPLSLSFLLLTALLYSALIMGVMWANRRVKRADPTKADWSVRIFRFFVGGFLLCVGMAALDGTFLDPQAFPPKIVYAVLPALVGVLVLALHPLILKWIREIPQRGLIGLQSFRLVVEIQLYFLAKAGLISTLLTFEGRNYDILIGLSAPFAAWYVHRKHRQNQGSPKFVVAWNVIGLLLLGNVVAQAFMSFPSVGLIIDPPGSLGIMAFPYAWLPSFMVPLALLLHILSLKREWSFHKNPAYKTR